MTARGAALAVGLLLLLPGSAPAQDPQACVIGGGPHEYQAKLLRPLGPSTTLLDHGSAAARERLAAQFAGIWLSDRRQGWAVGVAPGALSVEQARTAIVEGLTARVSGADLETLASLLHVHPQPYAWADLEAVQAQLVAQLEGLASAWSAGIACPAGDAFRVEVWLYNDATPESIARAQEVVAPFGDRARLTVTTTGPPAPAAGAAPRLGRLVALPRRCVRGRSARIAVRPAARSLVRRLTVTVRGKRRSGSSKLRLAGRRTRIKVAVRLHDGRRVERVVVLRRCG